MSLYEDICTGVDYWSRKPHLYAERDFAIRQAIRAAHRAGSFARDLVTVPLTGLDSSTGVISIDLSVSCPRLRQLATVKPLGVEKKFDPIDITDLFDPDGYYRTDVFYIVGTTLNIRPSSAASDVEITYYKQPLVSPLSALDSWIADEYQDVIILWAAANMLTLVGEQEIKTRVETLLKVAYDDLVQDNVTITRN